MSSHLFFYKLKWAFLWLTSAVPNQQEFMLRVDLGRTLLDSRRWEALACSKCDKSFTDNSDMKKHYMSHTEERPFACTKYDISLLHSINLKKHERTYTGEIHLSVQNVTSALQEIVILSFITWLTKERSNLLAQNLIYHFHSSDLKKHERTHTGDDPFACS